MSKFMQNMQISDDSEEDNTKKDNKKSNRILIL